MQTLSRGVFIVFEGGDGSGKSTQFKKAVEYLQDKNFDVIATREPGGGDEKYRNQVLYPDHPLTPLEEFDIVCADRALHFPNVIIPALKERKIVLCDRNEPSSVAYQGYAGGVDIGFIRMKSKEARQGIWPDLILLFDMDPEAAFERAKKRGEKLTWLERKPMEFHKKVRGGYLQQAHESEHSWRIIDASPSEEEVWEQTKKHIDFFFLREFDIMLEA